MSRAMNRVSSGDDLAIAHQRTRPRSWVRHCSDQRCRTCDAFATREQQIGVESRWAKAMGFDRQKPRWSKRLYIGDRAAPACAPPTACSVANPCGPSRITHSLETLFSREPGSPKSAACGTPSRGAYRPCWRRGRVAEGGGLLNRYRVVKPYRGFESLRLRQNLSFPAKNHISCYSYPHICPPRVCGRCSAGRFFAWPSAPS
jgi:hypothetical protein